MGVVLRLIRLPQLRLFACVCDYLSCLVIIVTYASLFRSASVVLIIVLTHSMSSKQSYVASRSAAKSYRLNIMSYNELILKTKCY